ncbi:cell division protein FtsB [Alcaligenes faecalis]|jgi:cell division protein FtsB|uniref:Cell division protein FtsB n=3 Tax=Alcaligenes TaxID=507 RepID=A0ABY7N133_ALCFA|nr:cell division protein FtsB [Alcaligenes faecalis]WBM36961.1 cell division protein FtsB [Alcaligenes faecalis]
MNRVVRPGSYITMRLIVLLLLCLTLVTHYALWWGKGGWLDVRQMQTRLVAQKETNEALTARNNALLAEVQDLRSGTHAVEERARSEFGMMREGEIFVQIVPPGGSAATTSSPR